MEKPSISISFECNDRLNQTKCAKSTLEKENNRHLIEKLLEFQTEVNSILTDIVNAEKDAIDSKKLTKNQTDLKEDDDEDESSEDETESNGQNLKRSSDENITVTPDKKICK